MSYRFIGRLCGYICDECPEPLARVEVLLYRLAGDRKAPTLVAARPADTFRAVDEDEARQREHLMVGRGETDENGAVTIDVGDREYDGGPLEVDFRLVRAPGSNDRVLMITEAYLKQACTRTFQMNDFDLCILLNWR